jgi:hypothetical protein
MNLMATVKKVAKKAATVAKKVEKVLENIALVKGSPEWLQAKADARKKLDNLL